MVAPPKTPHEATRDDEAEDREAILGRRARFIATALSALAIGTAAVPGCDSDVTREQSGGRGGGDEGGGGAPQPCLDVAPDTASTGEGGAPQPCLGMPAQGGGGMGGTDGSGGADGGAGGEDGEGGGFGGGGGALPCLAPEVRFRR